MGVYEEHERSKKYTPGIGAKWQHIAEDWSDAKKKENDFKTVSRQKRKGKHMDLPNFEEKNPEAYGTLQKVLRKRKLITMKDPILPPAPTMKYTENVSEDLRHRLNFKKTKDPIDSFLKDLRANPVMVAE